MEERHPAVARVLRQHDAHEVVPLLAEQLRGADLSSLLLEVFRRRAADRRVADVLEQYRQDRFVRPGAVDAVRLAECELVSLQRCAPSFEPVVLSPLAPFAAHAAVAGVSQNRVVSTGRRSEVAADPTVQLALEAVVRRRQLLAAPERASTPVALAGIARVVRAQRWQDRTAFAHFSLLGLVTAGRDTGGRAFERGALTTHVTTLVAVARAAGATGLRLRLTDFSGRHATLVDGLVQSPPAAGGVDVVEWPSRERGRGYYPSICFKLDALVDGEPLELADGGLVDWGQALLGSRKERLLISGVSIERLATL